MSAQQCASSEGQDIAHSPCGRAIAHTPAIVNTYVLLPLQGQVRFTQSMVLPNMHSALDACVHAKATGTGLRHQRSLLNDPCELCSFWNALMLRTLLRCILINNGLANLPWPSALSIVNYCTSQLFGRALWPKFQGIAHIPARVNYNPPRHVLLP